MSGRDTIKLTPLAPRMKAHCSLPFCLGTWRADDPLRPAYGICGPCWRFVPSAARARLRAAEARSAAVFDRVFQGVIVALFDDLNGLRP